MGLQKPNRGRRDPKEWKKFEIWREKKRVLRFGKNMRKDRKLMRNQILIIMEFKEGFRKEEDEILEGFEEGFE